MSNVTLAMFKDAVKALYLHDQTLAKAVVARDVVVDEHETELEALCLKFLALYAPKAFELRYVAAASRMSDNLERVADHSAALAREVQSRHLSPLATALPAFLKMTDLAAEMIAEAVDSFFRIDAGKHQSLAASDLVVGQLQRELNAALVARISQDPDVALEAVSLINVVRRIERAADHAKNISALVPYVASGTVLRRQGGEEPEAACEEKLPKTEEAENTTQKACEDASADH
jgi:phosphate transport system protein